MTKNAQKDIAILPANGRDNTKEYNPVRVYPVRVYPVRVYPVRVYQSINCPRTGAKNCVEEPKFNDDGNWW